VSPGRISRRVFTTGLVAASALVRAQAGWPMKVIKLIVPFRPGGSTDVLARLIANRLKRVIPGCGFVIDHRPGAGG
jgi:tripartite-type tricarboxylate transporter receptor subunit TctC